MARVLNFEQGLNDLVQIVLKSKNRPTIISIHGFPNSGKTELRVRAHRILQKQGKMGWIAMCKTPIAELPQHPEGPDYFLIEDLQFIWPSKTYALDNFSRFPDLSSYIAKRFCQEKLPRGVAEAIENGDYQIIIENPAATVKSDPHSR